MNARERFVSGWFVSLVATWALCATPARANVYVVDPNGTEGFKDLQTALDTVPPGSTLFVKGYHNDCPWFVSKSVTIIGLEGWGGGVTSVGSDPDVLFIDAGADAIVTLKDVKIDGGWAWGPSYDAIHVRSVGDLVVMDSVITGGRGLAGTCEYYFRNANAITVESARTVAIVGSRVKGGGPGDTLWSEASCPDTHQADGGAGISCGAALLLLENSSVEGGGGSDVGYYCGWDGSDAPYEPIGSNGGPAVDAGVTWISNSTLTGGAAGQGVTMGCLSDLGQPGNPGADFYGIRGDLPDLLAATEALAGKPITLTGGGFTPSAAALLFLSSSLAPPIAIRQGVWFLDVPFHYVGVVTTDGAGGFALTTTFPDDSALLGATFVLQATDLVRLSEPTLLVPRRRKP